MQATLEKSSPETSVFGPITPEPQPKRIEADAPDRIQVAAGTIIGREHLRLNRPNQDGFYFRHEDGQETIGVVCDGCSSSEHSDLGAKIGARILAQGLRVLLPEWETLPTPDFLEYVRVCFIHTMKKILPLMGDTLDEKGNYTKNETVSQYFLFTALGFVIGKKRTAVFSIGDGVVALNGEVKKLNATAGNKPVYIAYGGMLNTELSHLSNFEVQFDVPTESVKTLLIGCDGLHDLMAAKEKNVPGNSETIGDVNQFWSDDKYFTNKDAVRRRLSLINRTVTRLGKTEHGPLNDDTTLIVARRVK
jgi:hypothetical protein